MLLEQGDPDTILAVKDLSITFGQHPASSPAVSNLSFTIARGETLALVGGSGSGKSVTSLALMNLLDQRQTKIHGERWLRRQDGTQVNLAELSQAQWRSLRGADMAMIFQEPMTALNPVLTLGRQLTEVLSLHQAMNRKEAYQYAIHLLEKVQIKNPAQVMKQYPHQLSGGMRQRVMIAMALSCRPVLLIADEPTTALDVTIQAQILDLIKTLQQEQHTAVLFITHDMGVVSKVADRVIVMQQGQQVETAEVNRLFTQPQQAYTRQLLAAVPKLGDLQHQATPKKFQLADEKPDDMLTADIQQLSQQSPLLQVKGLVTRFPLKSKGLKRQKTYLYAVDHISFEIYPGETLALVGESGSGKSTTGRSLLRLIKADAGQIVFNGQRVDLLHNRQLNPIRREIQYIFQDPYASLDPRQTVESAIIEPLMVHQVMSRSKAKILARQLLKRVGLLAEHAERYPHQFSGGQRQRICIARALALKPKLIIADEAVSALDVSVQAQIINLLIDLQRETGIALLFISHDMAVVERISHRIAVLYGGKIVEIGPRQQVLTNPQHPYTRNLIAAVPTAKLGDRDNLSAKQSHSLPRPTSPVPPYPPGVAVPLIEVGEQHFVASENR